MSWSFTTEASPPQILVVTSTARPFGSYLGEILAQRGPERVHDDRRRVPLAGAPERLRRRRARRGASQPGAGVDADRLGERRREPRRDAPRQAARRSVRAHGRKRHALERLPEGRHGGPGQARASSGSTIQFHGTADRYTLNGATAVATLYSNATTATANPAVTLRSVGSSGGQAAAFTYDLARSVVYTRQGNPAWAGQERDGVVGIRPDDMFYSTLARHEQDRDPAGRRAAAAAAQPDHADERRPDAAAALLVPARAARRRSS